MRPTAFEMATALALRPHPEGGFFRETYRAAGEVETPRGRRPACTAILFLVTATRPSRLHRLSSDELWIAQGGVPLELITIDPHGELERHVLASSGDALCDSGFIASERHAPAPQVLVPAGAWQGARVADVEPCGECADGAPAEAVAGDERAWSLVSCVVSPGFSYEDFEIGERAALQAAFPRHSLLIAALTATR